MRQLTVFVRKDDDMRLEDDQQVAKLGTFTAYGYTLVAEEARMAPEI
jgi:hypothetical protein